MAEQNIGCLHDYTLTSEDVRLLNDADAFVINGAGMEAFIEDAYKNVESLFVVDSSTGIELICDETSHNEEEHSHEEDHSHNHSVNAHIWLSIENAKKQIENIKKYSVPVVVAINKFLTDSKEEEETIKNFCEKMGVKAALSEVWEKGGEGGKELAEAVINSEVK